MTHQQMQHEIISCIWSKGLKQHIASIGYNFTEQELLGIAFHCAPTFEERLRLLHLLSEYAPSVSAQAAKCMDCQNKSLDHFRQSGEQEVYELHIKNEPDAYEERYLCASYDAALEMIDAFYKEYDEPETDLARYVIEKRKIHRPGQPFSEDSLGECVLAAGKVILSVDVLFDGSENSGNHFHCTGCSDPWVWDFDVRFPVPTSDLSVVQYKLPDGSLHYGVNLTSEIHEITQAHYIIPLDGENGMLLKRKAVDTFWSYHDHEHIPAPFVEEIPVQTLPAELQENYQTFLVCMSALHHE